MMKDFDVYPIEIDLERTDLPIGEDLSAQLKSFILEDFYKDLLIFTSDFPLLLNERMIHLCKFLLFIYKQHPEENLCFQLLLQKCEEGTCNLVEDKILEFSTKDFDLETFLYKVLLVCNSSVLAIDSILVLRVKKLN